MSAGQVSTKVATGFVPIPGDADIRIENGNPIIIDSFVVANAAIMDQVFLATNTANETIYRVYLNKGITFSHYGPLIADKGMVIKSSPIAGPPVSLVFYSIFYRLSG